MPYAILDIGKEGKRSGVIVSLHPTCEEAARVYREECALLARRYPLIHPSRILMVCQLPTPDGGTGEVGDRIPIMREIRFV